MLAQLNRPQTPPAHEQLLTPPPTEGRLPKRVHFADEPDSKPASKRHATSQKVEDSQESSSPPSFKFSNVPDSGLLDKQFLFADDDSCVVDVPTTEPFRFLELPLHIRNRVYGILLTIPALICVRQNHTSSHHEKKAYLYAEKRELLPGIAYALAHLAVSGNKFRFSCFQNTNAAILRVSKKIHAEAQFILYGKNNFEIILPTLELSPPANFRTPLFPRGYQRLVRKLNICICSFYGLQWLMNGMYAELKNSYRGLESLTLILEMESAQKGYAKQWARKEKENWTVWVKRLHKSLAVDFFKASEKVKPIPVWIDLRVVFHGERYDEQYNYRALPRDGCVHIYLDTNDDRAKEHALRLALKRGLVEAFELLKRGGAK